MYMMWKVIDDNEEDKDDDIIVLLYNANHIDEMYGLFLSSSF